MLDLDDLKAVNDRFGHIAGDQVLRSVADIVRGGVRKIDVAARYGGDEFVIMLPDTPARGALEVGERIRHAVESTPYVVDSSTVTCTVSIGVASFPQDGRSMEGLLARADSALYLAKKAGRNRVVQCEPVAPRSAPPAEPGAQIPTST
jgi:diguanylate cyclase (GGDEF)-like protein